MSFLNKKKKQYEKIVGEEEQYRDKVEEELDEESETLKEGMRFIVEKSFPVPKIEVETMDTLEFPDDISAMTDDNLLDQMSKWTLMIDYMQFELARADTDRIAKLNRYNIEKSKFFIEAVDEGEMSLEMSRQYSNVDPYILMLLKTSDVARAKHTLIDALLKGYNQNYKLLSRELTKRGLYNPSQDGKRSV